LAKISLYAWFAVRNLRSMASLWPGTLSTLSISPTQYFLWTLPALLRFLMFLLLMSTSNVRFCLLRKPNFVVSLSTSKVGKLRASFEV